MYGEHSKRADIKPSYLHVLLPFSSYIRATHSGQLPLLGDGRDQGTVPLPTPCWKKRSAKDKASEGFSGFLLVKKKGTGRISWQSAKAQGESPSAGEEGTGISLSGGGLPGACLKEGTRKEDGEEESLGFTPAPSQHFEAISTARSIALAILPWFSLNLNIGTLLCWPVPAAGEWHLQTSPPWAAPVVSVCGLRSCLPLKLHPKNEPPAIYQG